MSNLLVSLYKAFTVRKRVHWVQRHIANNDLNIMPFQMSLNVRLTVYLTGNDYNWLRLSYAYTAL